MADYLPTDTKKPRQNKWKAQKKNDLVVRPPDQTDQITLGKSLRQRVDIWMQVILENHQKPQKCGVTEECYRFCGWRQEEQRVYPGRQMWTELNHRMEVQTVQLCIKDLRVITGSLQNIISRSYGPRGGQTLMMSSTGQITVTSDCVSILSALHFSHPVTKVIVDTVRSFVQAYGDGGKTVLTYTHELLSAIEMNIADMDFNSNAVSKSLYEFTNSDLLCICGKMQEFVFAQNCKENIKYHNIFENPVYYIIRTCFSGLPTEVVNHLASIVATFMCATENGQNVNVVLKFCDTVLLMLPSASYMKSYVSDGLFLQGIFTGHQSSASSAMFIFMQCSLEGNVDSGSTDVAVLNCTPAESFFTYRTEVASTFLHRVKSAGVSLIITTQEVPDYVLQICYRLNINILACVDNNDIEFVTYITGKLPVISIYESLSEKNIVSVSLWENVHTEGKHFVKILPDMNCDKYTPHSLFLCAPTEGLCQQLKMLVKKSMKVVEHYLLGTASESFKDSSSDRLITHLGLNEVNSPSVLITEFRQTSAEMFHATDRELHMNIDKFRSRQSLSALKNTVAGGGYFENILICFLQHHAVKNISYQKQFCCRIVIKMLEAVPKILHDNQIASQSFKSHNFLCAQKEVMEAINNAVVSGLNAQSMCTSLERGALDVVNIKFEMVFTALNLVVRLLRIDAIIGVKGLVKDAVQVALIHDNTE